MLQESRHEPSVAALTLWFAAGVHPSADGRIHTGNGTPRNSATTVQQFPRSQRRRRFRRSGRARQRECARCAAALPGMRQPDADSARRTRFGRTSVTARCDTPQPWAASMTATIEVWRPVVVHRARVARRHGRSRPTTSRCSRATWRTCATQYITDANRAVGWTTRRPVAAGDRAQRAPARGADRGQQRRRGAHPHRRRPVAVSMNGTALDKGMPGEQIAVRNVQSDRVIKAWVVGRAWCPPARASPDQPAQRNARISRISTKVAASRCR